MGTISCNHEIMHMSNMMLEKCKQGITGEFERNVNFLGDALSNRETTHKIWKFKTCDDESDIYSDDNEPEGGSVTGYFTIGVFFCLLKMNFSATKMNFEKPPVVGGESS